MVDLTLLFFLVDVEEYYTILVNDTAGHLAPVGIFIKVPIIPTIIIIRYELNIKDGLEMLWINFKCPHLLLPDQRDNVQFLAAKAHQIFAFTIELKILGLLELI